jgi:hypothetical protein
MQGLRFRTNPPYGGAVEILRTYVLSSPNANYPTVQYVSRALKLVTVVFTGYHCTAHYNICLGYVVL